MGRMTMRRRHFAGKNHLIGTDQRPHRREIVARKWVAQDEITPFGERYVDQTARRGQCILYRLITPMRRHKIRSRLLPEDRTITIYPTWRDIEPCRFAVKIVQRIDAALGACSVLARDVVH